MIRRYRFLCSCLVIITAVGITACSDVQNRDKKSSKKSPQGAISLKVDARSTTSGTATVPTLDADLEKKITKNLARVLVNGTKAKDAFSAAAAPQATQDFPDNRKAKKNSAKVIFSYMKTDSPDTSLVVAEVQQTITTSGKETVVKTGKVFFELDGTIIGFEFNPLGTIPVTTAKASA